MESRADLSLATRSRLLDATADVVAEVGGAGLTMQAVAAKADVALRTVYNYFPSKEALVLEAYNRLAGDTMAQVETLPTHGPARQQLGRLVEMFCDSYASQAAAHALVAGVPGIPELEARVSEVRQWRREKIKNLLRSATKHQRLRLGLSDATNLAFWATAYASWDVLVNQAGMPAPAAKALLVRTVDTAVFDRPSPSS